MKFLRWMFTWPQQPGEAVLHGMAWSVPAFLVILAVVIATGSTFGQRCAEVYSPGSAEWDACTVRLSKGGEVRP